MKLLLTTLDWIEQEVDVLDALRDHDPSVFSFDDEMIEKLEDFREDLFRIDRQRDELIRLLPNNRHIYKAQHKKAEEYIARQIAKLKIPGVKAV